MGTLALTPEQRLLLRRPLGELIPGNPEESLRKLKDVVEREKPPRLVLVGDAVSRNAVRMGLNPDVIIVDTIEKRQQAVAFRFSAAHILKAKNVAGTIGSEAWDAVVQAIRLGDSVVRVEGEEDLLTLVAILSSPDMSIIVYGQPDEGIVLVRVSEDKKKEISGIIERMEKRN